MDLVTPSLSQIFQSPVVPRLPEAAYGSSSPQQGKAQESHVAVLPHGVHRYIAAMDSVVGFGTIRHRRRSH